MSYFTMMPVIKHELPASCFFSRSRFSAKKLVIQCSEITETKRSNSFLTGIENKACRKKRECAHPRTEITRPARIMTMPTTLFKVQCSLRMNTPSSMPIGSPSWRNTWTYDTFVT